MAAWIPIAMTAVSMLQQQQGAEESAAGAKESAARIAEAKRFEAAQLRQQADTAVAAGQISATEQRRQARMVQSRTLAVAAASGAGVSDPTMVNILARTAGEGFYRSSVALYGGEERARLLRMQAAAADYEGAAGIEGGDRRASAYEIQSGANLLSGGSSLFQKFNTGGFFNTGGSGGIGGPTGAGNFDFPGMA